MFTQNNFIVQNCFTSEYGRVRINELFKCASLCLIYSCQLNSLKNILNLKDTVITRSEQDIDRRGRSSEAEGRNQTGKNSWGNR